LVKNKKLFSTWKWNHYLDFGFFMDRVYFSVWRVKRIFVWWKIFVTFTFILSSSFFKPEQFFNVECLFSLDKFMFYKSFHLKEKQKHYKCQENFKILLFSINISYEDVLHIERGWWYDDDNIYYLAQLSITSNSISNNLTTDKSWNTRKIDFYIWQYSFKGVDHTFTLNMSLCFIRLLLFLLFVWTFSNFKYKIKFQNLQICL